MSCSRSAELLRSFENKVASPCPIDRQRRRPTSVVAKDDMKPKQERPPLLLSEAQEEQQQQEREQEQQEKGDGQGCDQPQQQQWQRPQSREDNDRINRDAPSSPSGTRLASMHKRPGSRSWVHRRSLPSLLLTDDHGAGETKPRSRGRQASATPLSSRASSGAAGTLMLRRKRGKWRAVLENPSGRMQRLDKTPPVTVGDAWGGGLSSRGTTEGGQRSRESKVVGGETSTEVDRVQPGRDGRAGSPLPAQGVSFSDGKAGVAPFVAGGSSGIGASASSGKLLLLEAVSEPLLCVGGGGGYQLRS